MLPKVGDPREKLEAPAALIWSSRGFKKENHIRYSKFVFVFDFSDYLSDLILHL